MELLTLEATLVPSNSSLYRLLATLNRRQVVVEHLTFDSGPDRSRLELALSVPDGQSDHIRALVEREVAVVTVDGAASKGA